ncbi:Uncharacterised protein [Mycobacteroides abscessus subsp. massiliense]|nr:Uncharacterised protein [Mycobacteroides abscessus subsp. massiliense]
MNQSTNRKPKKYKEAGVSGKTIRARWAAVKGSLVCAAIGHNPRLATEVKLWPGGEIQSRTGAYCGRCLSNVGD